MMDVFYVEIQSVKITAPVYGNVFEYLLFYCLLNLNVSHMTKNEMITLIKLKGRDDERKKK